MIKKLLWGILFFGVLPQAEANEFLKIRVLTKNVRPGDTVIVGVVTDQKIKEAALIDGNRRLPCFEHKNKWSCVIGIPSDFKGNLLTTTLDVKAGDYWHMMQAMVKVGKRTYPRISWPTPKSLPPEIEKRFLAEKEIFREKIEKPSREFIPVAAFIPPLKNPFKITSSYGEQRIRPEPNAARIHNGVDMRAKADTPVLSPNDGVVEIADDFYFEGGFVLVNHGGGIKSDFMHLSRFVVKAGDRVSRGQVIGYSGKSGEGIKDPHLHFEIWIHNTPVDPLKFIKDFNKVIF